MKIAGNQILAARNLLGLTQVELAEAAGVSDMTIANFETGKTYPQRATLDRILAELDRRGIEFTNGTGTGIRLNHAKAAEFARTSQAQKGTR
jgi:transcriptional regulator with XRE-family HTH domain